MSLASKLLSASGGGADKLYVDDVFSTYLYTGNGATQTINNGIDLAGKGGLVWIKNRVNATPQHALYDSQRGANRRIISNLDVSEGNDGALGLSFGASGFALNGSNSQINNNTQAHVSWTFRRAPKFFDVVTYTGNGANRTIAHSLGQEVGMILIKRTNAAADWQVYHRSLANTEYMVLNSTAAKATGATRWNSTKPTTSVFSLGTDASVNASGGTYVAYIFAHDTSADGIIQCGSYIGNATGPIVNLGWEPQYLMVKNASGIGNWQIIDSMRGMPVGSADATLQANLDNAESSVDYVNPTATGFQVTSTSSEVNSSGSTYIYMAIRRPNKPPTTGTQVYNAIARTGTGTVATITGVGFAPDLVMSYSRNAGNGTVTFDRLRGVSNFLETNTASSEFSNSTMITSYDMNGVSYSADSTYARINYSSRTFVNHFFKRAPGFFDIVCYRGDGMKPRALNHALGVPVEIGFIKARSESAVCNQWTVKLSAGENIGRTSGALNLNATFGWAGWNTDWSGPSSTSSVFYVNASGNSASENNTNGTTYVAYLFASLPGISKVGSYTGNGSSQTVDCGFTTGARFILIKRTDSTGDWYVWDTARGVVAGNDPHLSLNTTAVEVTTNDSIDPNASGFIVNQVAATNINVSGGTYIFLAIA